jgi:hypothetical protein
MMPVTRSVAEPMMSPMCAFVRASLSSVVAAMMGEPAITPASLAMSAMDPTMDQSR